MGYLNTVILLMELTGTMAFASSGAMLAIQKEMDLFGVCVLGVTTSVGGGLVRDLILGRIPPGMFQDPIYTIVAILTSMTLFLLIYAKRGNANRDKVNKDKVNRDKVNRDKTKKVVAKRDEAKKDAELKKLTAAYNQVMLVFDAVGLGIFTVVGIYTARDAGYTQKFLLLFVGVITGVGGGLLRDMMAQEKPYILTKHVYASASVLGASVCVLSYPLLGELWSMAVGLAVIVLVRFLATHYHWNLPKIKG